MLILQFLFFFLEETLYLCLSQAGPLCQICVAKIAPEILKSSEKMRIFVRSQSGRSYTLEVEFSTTVGEVKKRSSNLLPTEISLEQLDLIFKKEKLKDEHRLLSYYGIQKGFKLFYLIFKIYIIFGFLNICIMAFIYFAESTLYLIPRLC